MSSGPSYPSDVFAHHKTVNTMQSHRRFKRKKKNGDRREGGSCQCWASPLSGRHLLAAEKPLTKFAMPLGEGALTKPRAPTRKTGIWEAPPPAEARAQRPGQEKPRPPGAVPPPPCTRGHSRTRAHTHTHVRTQQKEAVRAACGGRQGAPGSSSSRPGPAHWRGRLRGTCAQVHAAFPARSAWPRRPQRSSAPPIRTLPSRTPADPARAAVGSGLGSLLPGFNYYASLSS